MSHPIAMGAQIATNAARFGWYYGINSIVDRQTQRLGRRPRYRPRRPVPETQELMGALASLFLADAQAVRRGLYPPAEAEPGGALGALARVRDMLADLPGALSRRESEEADSARETPAAAGLPDYYVQDFHFQTGGYLTETSARLYDVQVETLFYGAAGAMRRAGFPAIADAIRGRDQRQMTLLDIACGTGRFLREIRLAWPALGLTGLDLSQPYLSEARRHLGNLRPASLIEGNAETIPLPDASQDIVTSVFLFHELPPDVRRRVAAEIARVLKPGGTLVFIDSLQMGDRPGWDGLLEAFPVRFHEPYFRHYAIDDFDGVFSQAGLEKADTSLAFLSKVMVRRRS
jgi:ubiquinone/menaquinone biosynthesis C-methylase UbiE